MREMIPIERIESRIYLIRGQKVMLDRDLAELYGVPTRVLKQAVRRNTERFPEDFMFTLSKHEIIEVSEFMAPTSRSQIVILKRGENIKYAPYAFTENGIAMLSSVLRSKRAIQVNIQIMRAFTRMRRIFAVQKGLVHIIKELKQKVNIHDTEIQEIFEAIRKMLTVEQKPKRRIGFKA